MLAQPLRPFPFEVIRAGAAQDALTHHQSRHGLPAHVSVEFAALLFVVVLQAIAPELFAPLERVEVDVAFGGDFVRFGVEFDLIGPHQESLALHLCVTAQFADGPVGFLVCRC